jgi:hypothetical protein
MEPTGVDETTRTEIEAAIYRKLIAHLQRHPDVQNIDLMNLAFFCRNCLSKWYLGEAQARGIEMDYDQARELVYGMPYEHYKARHLKEASPEQLRAFSTAKDKATD